MTLAALALACIALAALVALGATRALDRATLDAAQSIASPGFDLVASLVSILGQADVTSVIAVAIAIVWWRRQGVRGLVPLLLFAGVLLEVGLKFVVPHPGPPRELDRNLELLPFLKGTSPFSFPSGHMLRTTFLALLLTAAAPRWRPAGWLLVVVMALTRVYLGEHWLSDVVGGLLLGAALALVGVEVRRVGPA